MDQRCANIVASEQERENIEMLAGLQKLQERQGWSASQYYTVKNSYCLTESKYCWKIFLLQSLFSIHFH